MTTYNPQNKLHCNLLTVQFALPLILHVTNNINATHTFVFSV